MADLEDVGMSAMSTLKKAESGQVDQLKEQSVEAPIPKGFLLSQDDEEADCASVTEKPATGSEPAEQPPEPAPQEEMAADDPKETRVKP